MLFIIIYFLTLAQGKKDENREESLPTEIHDLSVRLREIVKENLGKTLNLSWESTNNDKESWLIKKDGKFNRSYFMKIRESSDEKNYKGILILWENSEDNILSVYLWVTEDGIDKIAKLWTKYDEITENIKKYNDKKLDFKEIKNYDELK